MKHPGGSITRPLSLVIVLACGSAMLFSAGVAASLTIGPGQLAVMIGVLAFIFVIATAYASKSLVSRSLASKPIRDLSERVREISASQDDAARVDGRFEGDEVAQLVRDLNGLLERVERNDQQVRVESDRRVQEERDRLEPEVATRTRELRESNKQLQAAADAAMASNDETHNIIADMTHELRTPMNGVMGMAELLFTTELTPQQVGYTRTILESSEDLLSLVNNILDLSKVEAGKLERIDDQPFSPRECVEKVSQLLVARAQMKGLVLSHECANDLPNAILGDGKRLRQVLINIIGNAIKFTDNGTIVVRTTLLGQVGDVSTIRFEIADTGIGIPEHLHEHVFEQFSQADRSTTRQFGGAGLGLTISKHLVELMRGKIGLVSQPGVGSNFWFTIKGEHRNPGTAASRDLGGVHALIVATDGGSRDALQNQLTVLGGSCVTVPNSEEALAALLGEAFDVILLDTQSLDGPSLAKEIRAAEAMKSLPLVEVSPVERSRGELEAIGVDGFLRKPPRDEELLASVARVTGRLDVVVPSDDQASVGSDVDEAVAGARVLVAEDHPVNREVTTTLLETLKCCVDTVVDGVQAVEAVQREPYDLVLLDCEMPNLDGYDAAIQIRRLEQQGQVRSTGAKQLSGHLPIVAVTAHVAPRDRARSVESGMDDFLSKPFTLQMLRSVLGRWVAGHVESTEGSPPSQVSANPSASSTSTDDAPISEAAIEQILELDRLNGGGVFSGFARTFLEAVPVTLEQLRTAVRDNDADGIARTAHALTGASLNVGAEPMAAASRELRVLVDSGTTVGASALATQLDDLFLAVKAALEAKLEQDQPEDVLSA
jgi:signal transduction histidine kinase/DNA-binding response OmpR family regulator